MLVSVLSCCVLSCEFTLQCFITGAWRKTFSL